MKNIQILKEIIEAVEKHSEFKVKNFDSNTTASENDEEIFFNIKFCLRKKENIDAVSEVPAAEVLPAGPGPKEETQTEEFFCESCGKKISWAENSYSNKHFNKPLCRACQAVIKGDK